jgi:RNA 2',3'-cyclic 3'-phosphodiesterase
MRLFFALAPDTALRASLGERGRAMARQIGGRAVPAGNLHLTLAFLGEVEPARVTPLHTVQSALAVEAFTLMLDRIGEWHHAGVAWIAPAVVPPPLSALHAQLNAALAAAGFVVESRPGGSRASR